MTKHLYFKGGFLNNLSTIKYLILVIIFNFFFLKVYSNDIEIDNKEKYLVTRYTEVKKLTSVKEIKISKSNGFQKTNGEDTVPVIKNTPLKKRKYFIPTKNNSKAKKIRFRALVANKPIESYFNVPNIFLKLPLQLSKKNTSIDSTEKLFFSFIDRYYNLHFLDSVINKINSKNITGKIVLRNQTNGNGFMDKGDLPSSKIDKLNCCPELAIDSFRINVPTLGQAYTIDKQKLLLDATHIFFKNFTVQDTFRNAITINGAVESLAETATKLDLNMVARNFGLLQVNRAISNQLYGFAAVDAAVHVGGTFADPIITGNVAMNDKAVLTVILPQSNLNKEVQQSVIRFIKKDSLIEQVSKYSLPSFEKSDTIKLLNLLDLNLRVTSSATLNFIIDPSAGDELNLHGKSMLHAKVDTAGSLLLFGLYTLDSGYYRLSNQYLQKQFKLVSGSTIKFTGAPGDALVAIKAEYSINTDAYDLLKNEIGYLDKRSLRLLKQQLPFKILLTLGGSIRNLKMSFAILIDSTAIPMNTIVRMAIENKLKQFMDNNTATNKQVFSLLLYDRFVGEQSSDFFSNAGAVNINSFDKQAYESVSGFLSAAIDNIAEDLFKTLDIYHNLNNFKDYGNGDAQQKKAVNIGATKSFINDRLILEVGKNYGIDGQDASAKAAQQKGIGFLPDVTLTYKLTKDGKYRYRSYKKNQFEVTVDGYVTESGVSFLVNMDYNNFKDLLKGHSKKVISLHE